MKSQADRSYRALLWSLALFGFLADQASKYATFRWLYNPESDGRYTVVAGVFELLTQYHPEGLQATHPLQTWNGTVLPKVNQGALFGLGNEHRGLANGLFAVISLLAAAAIVYWSTHKATIRDRFLSAALGLILAGTLGNLYDRLVFGGVRDFLHFYLFEWPVFNVADCCLVLGASLLLLQAFFGQPIDQSMAPSPNQAVTSSAE